MSEAFNEAAFPNTGNSTWNITPSEGMTLRDYFAGQAMVALAASVFEGAAKANMTQEFAQNSLIEGVYKLADAMLQERAK